MNSPKMQRSVVALILMSTLSGCATWPSVKPDKDLKPSEAASSPCITTSYTTARKCALLTIDEISTLLGSAGEFDRGTAYTALGLGTVTGGVLAYKESENTLKGLALISGGLLGLNTVVNTKQQRTVLEKGLREMTCSLRAAEALQSSSIQLKLANQNFDKLDVEPPISVTSADARMSALHANGTFVALKDEGAKALAMSAQTKAAIHLEALSKGVVAGYEALGSAQTSIGSKLSSTVIDIRGELRSRLAGLSPSADDLLKTQSSRIVEMTGDIVRKRSDLEKKQTEPSAGDDANAKKAIKASRKFVAETAPVAAVFRDCVDPATQREIEK